MIRKCVSASLLFLLLSACASNKSVNLAAINTASLASLESVRVDPLKPSKSAGGLSNLRVRSLKDSAMSLGARGGLAWASGHINEGLENDKKYLDSIFNFNVLMLEHGVLPPVLESSHTSLNLADPNTVRVADRTYKIVKQARFTTTPPNWREYLWLTFVKPELPDKTLLPRNKAEQKAWQEGIKAGWSKGIEQAYTIFQQNLARLKRDYNGMLLYRKLLAAKMIKSPYVARTELGITGDANQMRINDQVLRIVEHAKLQTNPKRWKPIVVKRKS